MDLKNMLTVGTCVVGIALSWGMMSSKLSANGEEVTALKAESTATRDKLASQRTDIELIKSDVKEIKGDVGTMQGDVRAMQQMQFRQEMMLSNILTEIKKTNAGP